MQKQPLIKDLALRPCAMKKIDAGNFPQTFVHSSFICAVNAYKLAIQGQDCTV